MADDVPDSPKRSLAPRSHGGTELGRDIMRAVVKAPYLEKSEEFELAVQWREKRDEVSLHKIASAHMRLVISMGAKFRHYGLPAEDVIQEGYLGLLEAAARFEPRRDVRFSTYARWWIRAAMQDYVLRNWSIVRGGTSSAQKTLFFRLRHLRAKIEQQENDLTPHEIHERIGTKLKVPAAAVEMMETRFKASVVSLDAPPQGEGSDGDGLAPRGDFLADDSPLQDELAENVIDGERRSLALKKAMKVLNKRELHIIRLRRLSDDGMTLEELAADLEISKERVRQVEKRALEKLRAVMAPDEAEEGLVSRDKKCLSSVNIYKEKEMEMSKKDDRVMKQKKPKEQQQPQPPTAGKPAETGKGGTPQKKK